MCTPHLKDVTAFPSEMQKTCWPYRPDESEIHVVCAEGG